MSTDTFSRHPKQWVLALCIILFAISGFESFWAPRELPLTFEESFVIGQQKSVDASFFMASPYQIRTDSRQNIYVAEGQQKTIMMFGSQGTYRRSIGRAGKGPGEFPSGPIFTFNKEGKIVALDLVSRRFTWFSKKGDILSEYAPSRPGMVWSDTFFQSGDSSYLFLKKPQNMESETGGSYRDYVFHRYSSSFENHIRSFGAFDKLVPKAGSKFVQMITNRMNAGNIVQTGPDQFWYAPGIYDGKVYQFKRTTGQWKLGNTYPGSINGKQAVVVGSDEESSISFVTYGKNGHQQRSEGKINSYSIGLVQTNGGKVLHFSGQRMQHRDSLRTMVEVFNPTGDLIGTGSFDEIAINRNLGYFSSHDPAIWMDNKNRFYFIDNNNGPVVRVGRIQGL